MSTKTNALQNLLLVLATTLLFSCNETDFESNEVNQFIQLNILEEQYEDWKALDIENYEFNLLHVGELEVVDLRINVANNEVFQVHNNTTLSTSEIGQERVITIDGIFDYAKSTLEALYNYDDVSVTGVIITYDADYKFPKAMTYNYTASSGIDYEIISSITNFGANEEE